MPDPIVNPPLLPPGVEAIIPVHARRGFVPQEGGFLNLTLGADAGDGGEIIRGEVERVIAEHVCLVRLKGVLVRSLQHGFKSGDLVPVRRAIGPLGNEIWIPINEREQQEREARDLAEKTAASEPTDRQTDAAAAVALAAQQAEQDY